MIVTNVKLYRLSCNYIVKCQANDCNQYQGQPIVTYMMVNQMIVTHIQFIRINHMTVNYI